MSEAGKKTARNYTQTGVSSVAINQHWETSPVLVVGNRKVEAGEIIKISQVWGTKFKFIRGNASKSVGSNKKFSC